MGRDQVLSVEVVRALQVTPTGSGLDHLSAASGLAVVGECLYVVADDEHSLGLFRLGDEGPGRWLPLFDEVLPSGHDERKALKADLEALTVLPELAGYPHGALLVAGSGSKPNRRRGALLSLDVHGMVTGAARPVDLTDIHGPLQDQFGELNIEGLFVAGDSLCLLQRGSKESPTNACIRFDLAEFGRWLTQAGPIPPPTSITAYDLGSINGVPPSPMARPCPAAAGFSAPRLRTRATAITTALAPAARSVSSMPPARCMGRSWWQPRQRSKALRWTRKARPERSCWSPMPTIGRRQPCCSGHRWPG